MRYLILLFFLGVSPKLWASFDQNFEYRSITEDERKVKNQRTKIDSEYQNDILASLFTDQEENLWRTENIIFMQSLGSLSGKIFGFDRRIKFERDLLENFSFKLVHFEQADYEQNQLHTIFEFTYKTTDWDYGFYFELAHLKRSNDFGFALTYHPETDHKIRFFHTWVDAERNLRNEDNDRFASMPSAYGFKGNLTRRGIETEYGVLIEPEFRWSFPSENVEYTYRRYMASLFLNMPLRGNYLSFRIQWDSKLDMEQTLYSENVISRLELDRFQTLVRHQWVNADTGLEYSVGLMLARRDWGFANREYITFDGIPHFGVMWPKRKTHDSKRWGFEYGATFHTQNGDWSQTSPNDLTRQNRADAIWEWAFNPQAKITFRFGFDLDDIVSKEFWQSGDGRFVMYF